LEGGIWRYNLRSNRVEVICHGTTNPWGHDFNEFGDLFFINTVNGHLWHGIHGAHFNRPFTLDPNPNVYATIDQHADHYHFDTGQHWTKSRDGAANDFGGGHAHCGLMIYQESTWPESYRGSLMTLNFHGRRANRENLIRRGTGYVGTHGDDFFKSDDKWFRGMEMSAGPDGNVFVLDWSDLGECHEHTGVHRNSGRVYKISVTADQQRPLVAARLDVLASDDVARMGGLVLGTDRWFSHQAMLRLCELKRKGFDMSPLKKLFSKQDSLDAVTHCRVLWLSHLTSLDEEIFEPSRLNITDHDRVRVVTLRQAFENCPIDDVYGPNMACRAAWPLIMDDTREFVDEMGKLHLEDSPVLRLEVASILQRLPESLRTRAAMNLLKISGDRDEGDHNMAKMIWFGIMHRASTHPHEMVAVAAASDIPEATTYIARSLAEQVDTAPNAFRSLLNLGVQKYRLENDPLARLWCNAMLTGIEQGIIGVRRVDKPDAWPELRTLILAASPDRQRLVDQLDALFGEGQSVEQLQAILDNNNADPLERLAAFKGLVAAWHQDGSQDATVAARLAAAARPLIGDARVNLAAAESLATIEHADVARVLIDNHGRFRWPLRASVVSLLCARATFATALIERLEQGKFDKDAINASHVRSIVSLGNEDLTQRLEAVWGRVRETPGERRDEITRLQSMLTPARLRQADLHAGRALFDRSCAACHKMFGNGETVGPDLTGAQRGSLEYLLGNIVDPDAVVGADYRATKILTDDGRLLVGLVTSRNRRTLTIASAARTETISLDDIEEELPTETSPMPSGLLQPLSDDEIANLIGYLQSPTQVAAN
jgi:putative heme-binding domain-containing protein